MLIYLTNSHSINTDKRNIIMVSNGMDSETIRDVFTRFGYKEWESMDEAIFYSMIENIEAENLTLSYLNIDLSLTQIQLKDKHTFNLRSCVERRVIVNLSLFKDILIDAETKERLIERIKNEFKGTETHISYDYTRLCEYEDADQQMYVLSSTSVKGIYILIQNGQIVQQINL